MYKHGSLHGTILGGDQTLQIYGNFGGFALENALIALFGLVSYNDPCNGFEIFQTCVARPTWTHITTTTSPVSSWVNPFKGILGIGKCASWVSFPVNAGEVCGFTCIHITVKNPAAATVYSVWLQSHADSCILKPHFNIFQLNFGKSGVG